MFGDHLTQTPEAADLRSGRVRHRLASDDQHSDAPLMSADYGLGHPVSGEDVHRQQNRVPGRFDELDDATLVVRFAVDVGARRFWAVQTAHRHEARKMGLINTASFAAPFLTNDVVEFARNNTSR